MSNQYYKFLSNQMISYLENDNLIAGNRYFLILNTHDEIGKMSDAIKHNENIKPQTFESKYFDFKTNYCVINDIKVIFVYVLEQVTHDFLVTIRNKISMQSDEWEKTAVVFFIKDELDSITNGSSDLAKQGAPFHTKNLKSNLEEILEKHSGEYGLEQSEKIVLDFIVKNNFEDEYAKFTLMDFESVFSIVEQGEIKENNYFELGLFQDKQLSSYSEKEIKERLNENKYLFNEISEYHDRGNAKERVEETFTGQSVINLLSNEQKWMEADYESVIKSKEKMLELKKLKIDFLEDEFRSQFEEVIVWDKPAGRSKVKSRERNIIIFNNGKLSSIELPFSKDINISSRFVVSRSAKYFNLYEKDKVILSIESKTKNKLTLDLSKLHLTDDHYFEFTYKHNDENAYTFKFKILILNCNEEILKSIKTNYSLRFDNKQKIVEFNVTGYDGETIGVDSNIQKIMVKNQSDIFNIKEYGYVFDFNELIRSEEDDVFVLLQIGSIIYKFFVNDHVQKITPLSAISIIKKVYLEQKSMSYFEKVVVQENNQFYLFNDFKNILEIESKQIEQKCLSGEIIGGEFKPTVLELPEDIVFAYNQLCEIIKEKETLPSLMYLDDDIIEKAEKYCEAVESKIAGLPDGEKIIDDRINNIHKIGFIFGHQQIKMTALHPLMLRYEILKTKKIAGEDINNTILKNYNGANLLPFYVKDKDYYFSEFDENNPRWINFNLYNNTNKLSSELTSFIINSRIGDFKKHFKYLFEINSNFSLKLRFINLNNNSIIFNGIINNILTEIIGANTIREINSIDIYLDELNHKQFINEFYNAQTYEELHELFDIKIPTKIKNNYEEEDILEILKEKINVYLAIEESQYHITFYNFNQEPRFSTDDLNSLNCSVQENGLLSSMSYTLKGNEYVTGFGIDGLTNKNDLIRSSLLFNSFAANARNQYLEPFKFDQVIVNNVTSLHKQEIEPIFKSTNWVTFIDPSVDLSYFNNSEYDLYVIHYNDQTSSQNYESITVTHDTYQYEQILKEFLRKVRKNEEIKNIENIIRSFNILNGEWLLRIIGNKSSNYSSIDNAVREKLSIVSAYKNLMALLDDSNIVWVPVSLEEILRVSRQQGLDSSSDIFSAKVLEHKGSISDDLLFIGIEVTTDMKVKVHLLPVEVKIGINDTSVVNKATAQIDHLHKLLSKELLNETDKPFTQKYYQTFFANIYFSNLKKFLDNGILHEDKYNQMLENRAWILNDDIHFDDDMNQRFAEGIMFLFKKGQHIRKVYDNKETHIIELYFNEEDAYIDAEKDFEQIKEEINSNTKGIDINIFSSQKVKSYTNYPSKDTLYPDKEDDIDDDSQNKLYVVEASDSKEYEIVDELVDSEKENIENKYIIKEDENSSYDNEENIDTKISNEYADKNQIDSKPPTIVEEKSSSISKISEDIRIPLGTIKGSTETLYWEYGNPQLSNRHLLITGKSGQGKTYFMQCLLYEFSRNNIDSLVIDYTDGFLPNQLEPIFVEQLGDKIQTNYVYAQKLAVNPFKRQNIVLGDFEMPESDDDIADRVVQIIDFVFNLGIQQNNLLKEAIKTGLRVHGDQFTFTKLKNDLVNDEENNTQTLYGRINTLLSRDPFTYDNNNFDWAEVFNFEGKVNIIQLKGYAQDVQKVITEFLLWDLYNYSQRSGNKNMPIPVLLDEMQNLNHKDTSPTSKILKEGRKFGWSSWLATQSLGSIKNAGGDTSALYNAALQIHFAAPEDQIKMISNMVATDPNERKRRETQLATLGKGECIVSGYAKYNEQLEKVVEVVEIDPFEKRL